MSGTGTCGSAYHLLSSRQADLAHHARRFAGDLSDLLNGTITHGVRISAAMTAAGTAVVGCGIKRTNLRSLPIRLRTRQPRTSLYLFVTYTLGLDEQDHRFLTATKSTYGLGTRETRRALRYDYERRASNEYPEAHLHLLGASERLAELVATGRPGRQPSRLHLPVGGRRFRPCLEDIIEFCIVEQLVEPRNDMWRENLNAKRDEFYRRQLKAAVRQDPETARSALEYRP